MQAGHDTTLGSDSILTTSPRPYMEDLVDLVAVLDLVRDMVREVGGVMDMLVGHGERVISVLVPVAVVATALLETRSS